MKFIVTILNKLTITLNYDTQNHILTNNLTEHYLRSTKWHQRINLEWVSIYTRRQRLKQKKRTVQGLMLKYDTLWYSE